MTGGRPMILDELAGKNYASTTQAAGLLDGADPRTVRRMCESGAIPSIRVGVRYMIPVSWLREHLGGEHAEPAPVLPDLDDLADRLADRMFARLARAFAGLPPDTGPV